MKRSLLFLAAALVFTALPDTASAQSRADAGWWEWAGRDGRTERTSPRTERSSSTGPSGTVRSRSDRTRTERRRTTREDRREATRRTERRTTRTERRRAERRDDDDRYDDDRYEDRDDDRWDDDRYENRGKGKKGKKGPKFCRNGVGHPTKGMAWCRDKGYADRRYDPRPDRRRDRRDDRWERRTIEDIIFGTPRDRTRRTRTVNRSVLDDVLGRRTLGDLERVASGSLTGRWVYPDASSRVLQLRDRKGPLAELTDFDGDNRVDLVLVDRTR